MENKNIILLKKRSAAYAEQCASYEEYERFDVTSCNSDPAVVADLSPLFIGPVTASDGEEAVTFENLWQYSKVYPRIYDADGNTVPGVDENGDPTADFWDWRRRFFATARGIRHPAFPRNIRHRDCLYSVYFENGELKKLNYVEARKKIYIPEYAKLVVNTATFERLKEKVEHENKLALVDFDAWNYYGKYMDQATTMKDAVNDPTHKVGHGYVIKALLQGDFEVIDGEVIDHEGILT